MKANSNKTFRDHLSQLAISATHIIIILPFSTGVSNPRPAARPVIICGPRSHLKLSMYIFYFDKIITAKPSLSEICDKINLIIRTIPTYLEINVGCCLLSIYLYML